MLNCAIIWWIRQLFHKIIASKFIWYWFLFGKSSVHCLAVKKKMFYYKVEIELSEFTFEKKKENWKCSNFYLLCSFIVAFLCFMNILCYAQDFRGCDTDDFIQPGFIYQIRSPNYSDKYPAGSLCRYKSK